MVARPRSAQLDVAVFPPISTSRFHASQRLPVQCRLQLSAPTDRLQLKTDGQFLLRLAIVSDKIVDEPIAGQHLYAEPLVRLPLLAAAMRTVKDWDTGGLIDVPVSIIDQQIGLGRIVRFSADNNWDMEQLTDWVRV